MSRLFLSSLPAVVIAVVLLGTACTERADEPPPRPPGHAPETSAPADSAPADTVPAHPHPAFARLQEALVRYETLAESGGWPAIPEGDVLEPGDTSDHVVPLRRRLAATGDLPSSAASEDDRVYDETLSQGVRRFQRRHGLAVDGLLGPATRAALNVPAEARVRTIRRNLKRWESLPDTLGRRYVLVNIPEYRLRAYDQDGLAESMAVIVGSQYDGRATPVFRDRIEYVVFRPYWNIPSSIAEEEILPEARDDRDFLVRNDYEIVSDYDPDAEVFDPHTTDLARVASGELRLRQKPGQRNALGLVKFMFPNEHAIYLHGTPEDQLFAETRRDFSHGCIRVEKPVDLALFTLHGQSEWTREAVEQAMYEGARQRVDLDEQIPVYIYYWTVFVDEDGTVQFRPDIYGHDASDEGLQLNP